MQLKQILSQTYKATDCCDFVDIYQNYLSIYKSEILCSAAGLPTNVLLQRLRSYINRLDKTAKCKLQRDIDMVKEYYINLDESASLIVWNILIGRIDKQQKISYENKKAEN
jgi:hypothetical protein